MSVVSFGRNTSKFKALLGIRARLILLALILVVPLMIDRVRVLESTRSKQVVQAASELSALARHTADSQREIVSTVQAVLKSAAFIYAAASKQGRGCTVMQTSLRVDLPGIRSLSILGRDGKVQCSTTQSIVGLDLSDRDYFKNAQKSRDFVLSDYIFSRAASLPTLMAAYPISAFDISPEEVIVAAIDLKWMSRLMAERINRAGVSVFLVDSTGVILASRPEHYNMIGQPLKDTSLLDAVAHREINLDRDSGTISFESADGERKAVSFARLAGTKARLIVSINESKMLSDIDYDILSAYVQLGVVGLLAMLGAWFAGDRLIIRPIRTMTDTASRFGRGDLSVRASSAGLPQEFAPLTRAFNIMASQLAEREREMVETNDRLTVIASLDMVSGLANRRGLQGRLEFEWMKALQTETDLSLLMIDVDHFKLFNDTYGHPEGDVCLSRIGETLAAIAAETSGFAARYGGEEFCLLLPNSDAGAAMLVGERIRTRVEQLAIPHGMSTAKAITVSVGVASISPSEAQPQDDLMEAADAALYAAKRRGRNTVVEHALIRVTDQDMSLAS